MKLKQQRPAKFSTRAYNRCKICGRPHAYLRKYGVCRICFRELAYRCLLYTSARRTGARVSGPVPLPTEKEIVTILRAVHKYKDSREQFESRVHKRLIDILRPSNKTVEALMGLELPAGVEIEIKL